MGVDKDLSSGTGIVCNAGSSVTSATTYSVSTALSESEIKKSDTKYHLPLVIKLKKPPTIPFVYKSEKDFCFYTFSLKRII